MTSVNIQTLDFNKGNLESKKVDVKVELTIESPKSVAFVVRNQLAKRRAGSAKVKSMSEISGTTAKPFKQKGTGNARQGSKRSVQFVGGRTCHGPTPRSFDFSVPKKIAKKALSDALKAKLTAEKIILFSDFGKEIKTSKISSVFKKNKVDNALIIYNGEDEENSGALVRSARNLKNVKSLDSKAVNVYDILKYDHILVDNNVFENKILGAL